MPSDKNLRRWYRSYTGTQLASMRKAKNNGLIAFTITSDPEGNIIYIGLPSTRSELQPLLEPIEEALKRCKRRTQASSTPNDEDVIVATSLQKPTVPVSSVTNEEARRLLPRWLRALTPDGQMGYGKPSHRPSFWPADVPWVGKLNHLSTAHLREAMAAVVHHIGEDPDNFYNKSTNLTTGPAINVPPRSDHHTAGRSDNPTSRRSDHHTAGRSDHHTSRRIALPQPSPNDLAIPKPRSRSTPVMESFSLLDSSLSSSLSSSPSSPPVSSHLTTLRPVDISFISSTEPASKKRPRARGKDKENRRSIKKKKTEVRVRKARVRFTPSEFEQVRVRHVYRDDMEQNDL